MNSENESLMQIEQLLRALLRATVSTKLDEIRRDKHLRQIFELTGGAATVKEIATKAKMSTGKVSMLWQSWEDAGLIVKEGKSYKKLV